MYFFVAAASDALQVQVQVGIPSISSTSAFLVQVRPSIYNQNSQGAGRSRVPNLLTVADLDEKTATEGPFGSEELEILQEMTAFRAIPSYVGLLGNCQNVGR